MRAALFLPLFVLSSCNRQESEPVAANASARAAATATYAGTDKDRLCYNAESKRMAMITYGSAANNCTMRGSFDGSSLRPEGDDKCQVPVAIEGNRITLINEGGPACTYYCGSGASYAGKTFARMDRPEPVTDIAGDPLC
jgi:hypothetical protein